jgi:23S rRNA (uracil1939-C5)-methyltransferase
MREPAAPKRELDLEIVSLVQGGRGMARHEGKIYFVAGALPGETVRASVLREQKNFAEASTVEILTSPNRKAPCAHFDDCGGCDWMRLPDELQLGAKADVLRHEASRTLGQAVVDAAWRAPVASPRQEGYRCRITLKLEPGPGRKAVPGYYAEGTHRFVPVTDCRIALAGIRAVIPLLEQDAEAWRTAGFTEIELRAADDADVPVGILHGKGLLPRRPAYLRGLATATETSGDCDVTYRAGGAILRAGPHSFIQVNLPLNDALSQAVLSAVEPGAAVVDAFCGVGNFSVPLAVNGHEVLGMEGNPRAIEDAERNAAANHAGARWNAASEADMLAVWQERKFPLDAALVLDPPRAGAKILLEALLRRRTLPKQIFYVSCEPSTLLRDLILLAGRSGATQPSPEPRYTLQSLQGFDMFPQTHHVETLAVLLRK